MTQETKERLAAQVMLEVFRSDILNNKCGFSDQFLLNAAKMSWDVVAFLENEEKKR